MKTKALLVAAIFSVTLSLGGAFTLDAIGYDGGPVSSDPHLIYVPGYGEVVFESLEDSLIVVSSAYGNGVGIEIPWLNFSSIEVVKIIIRDGDGAGLDNESASVSPGEGAEFAVMEREPQMVPEPTSAILGLLASVLLVIRRRS